MKKPIVIAIDGPAGAGKSTVAQKLAARLGWAYLDSGATYRAAALKVLEDGVSPDDPAAVMASLARAEIQLRQDGLRASVLLDGRDVRQAIRSPRVALAAARISRLPEVRKKLIRLQRAFARGRGVVMEGRDIGTVVFPQTALKIFLTAAPQERARRRRSEDRQQGRRASLEQTAREIRRRDRLDRARKISPLAPAPDACVLDSTDLSVRQVVERILKMAQEKKLTGTKQRDRSGSPTVRKGRSATDRS